MIDYNLFFTTGLEPGSANYYNEPWDWMRATGENPSKAEINQKIDNVISGLDNISGDKDTFTTAVKAMLWTESRWQQYNVGNSKAGTTNLNANKNKTTGVITSVDIGIGMLNSTNFKNIDDIKKLASNIDYNLSVSIDHFLTNWNDAVNLGKTGNAVAYSAYSMYNGGPKVPNRYLDAKAKFHENDVHFKDIFDNNLWE